jgi:hypothetical protein
MKESGLAPLGEYKKVMPMPHDYQLKCRIRQEILRAYVRKQRRPRRNWLDELADYGRDSATVLRVMDFPEIDKVSRDEHATQIRHFENGGFSRNYDLLRVIETYMRENGDPEFLLAMREYETMHLITH